MDWKTWGFLIVFGLIVGIMLVKQYWPSYRDDNAIEERLEDVIKDKTGIETDLTPHSIEK